MSMSTQFPMNKSSTLLILMLLFYVMPRYSWLLILVLIVVYGWKGIQKKMVDNTDTKPEIWEYYTTLISNKIVNTSPHTYRHLKAPKKIIYIYRHPHIVQLLEDMYVFRIYQSEILADMVILLEHFLKLHYNVMLGVYDVQLNIQVIIDLRNAITQLFNDFVFNLPQVSTVLMIPNIDTYVEKRQTHLENILNKLIRVMANKYPDTSERIIAFTCS